MDRSADIAIVGAGIVGLAHAYMALQKGYRVVLFEREQFASGASVRNFGLLWPIGQTPGSDLERALRSRSHWNTVAREAGFWLNNNGSMHLAYHDDEWDVLQEFVDIYKGSPYQCELLNPSQIKEKSKCVAHNGLLGGLWSDTEATVYAREAIRRIPAWLAEKYGLILRYGHVVTEVSIPHVKTAREDWRAERVFVCSGTDFETLYPSTFEAHQVSKCKLQMMKAVPKIAQKIGPTLCAGLTLRHYAAFSKCPSLPLLDQRLDQMNKDYKHHGIHVLLAQNETGELIIGDSHHYDRTVDPFDNESIFEIILNYLQTFTNLGPLQISERWHGVYPKVNGESCLVVRPEPEVTIVTGLGGAGMTLSFGLAEELIAE